MLKRRKRSRQVLEEDFFVRALIESPNELQTPNPPHYRFRAIVENYFYEDTALMRYKTNAMNLAAL